jgi:hypothetical protein
MDDGGDDRTLNPKVDRFDGEEGMDDGGDNTTLHPKP